MERVKMKDREKEIQHRRYEIIQELKELKKELLKLRDEENQIVGEKRLVKERKNKRWE
jgi:hypothetical protein